MREYFPGVVGRDFPLAAPGQDEVRRLGETLVNLEIWPNAILASGYAHAQETGAWLTVAHAWLADTGVNVDGLSILYAVDHALQKQTVHFLAGTPRPEGRSMRKETI